MPRPLEALCAHLQTCQDLRHVGDVLYWDMATYLPKQANPERGRQLALIGGLAHERFASDETGRLLAAAEAEGSAPGSLEADLLRVVRQDFDRATRIPAAFVTESETHYAALYDAWSKARPANDFAALRPMLERSLDLSRRYADFFPGYAHIMDPLIDVSDTGMTADLVRTLFADLRAALAPLVQAVGDAPMVDDSCLHGHFPEAAQREFGEQMVRCFGYDFSRGRQDKTLHPFMIRMGEHDVRITTRFDEANLAEGLFSTLHEAGHAMYEQGIAAELAGTALLTGASSGVHESQSRLWENLVGRSRAFWQWAYPQLQQAFPGALDAVGLDAFYRAINRVSRSLVRVEADELTYNLHVMIRFDLECALLEGSLEVRDLPDAWNARYQADLGLCAPDDRDGVLQDVHWYGGRLGGCFQGYTLGNIIAAQCFDAAVEAHPGIPGELATGEFGALHDWLRQNLYQYGRRHEPTDLIAKATGKPIAIDAYVGYLRQKFGGLYGLTV